ncbi:MAG: hypothetical protein OXL38_00300 [Gammaproteobacteria bacterium]|nr:hypothetical protein [Gammaproteobacteria bacterium]
MFEANWTRRMSVANNKEQSSRCSSNLLLGDILAELRKVKAQMVIERQIDRAPFSGGKTPSMVYKNLADASFLLDGLAGRPLTPNDVFLNTVYILD